MKLQTLCWRSDGYPSLTGALAAKYVALAFFIALCTATMPAPVDAAPIGFPLQTASVKLDGTALGFPLHPVSSNSLRYTVAFNPADRLYHLWVLNGGDTGTPPDMQVADITHATSQDGVNFISRGKLNPSPGWWTQIPGVGATVEPSVNYLRVDKLGAEWLLSIWSPNEVNTGRYNYNVAIWNIGSDINNLNIVQHGPLPSLSDAPVGPGGTMVGSFGMVNGKIYLEQDTNYDAGPPVTGGGIGRYLYTDGIRPTLSPVFGTSEAGLFSGTPYCWQLGNPNPCIAPQASYVHNSGRTIAQAAIVGAYYTFRDISTGARQDKQVWFVESADDGLTWSLPVGVYANGNAVLVDGLPNAGNFSSPEIVAGPAGFRVYFSTRASNGDIVIVSNLPDDLLSSALAAPALSDTMLALLAVGLALSGFAAMRRATHPT